MLTPAERLTVEDMFLDLQAIQKRLALHCPTDEKTLCTVQQMLAHCTSLLRDAAGRQET